MAKPRILIIDDEAIVRISCKKCLAPEDYDVDSAENGITGLQMVKSNTYDLILTDLKMPNMDGIEFLSKIKESHPKAKVIMITGYSTTEHAEQAMKSGAYNYIEKPFTPETLVKAVKEALGDTGKP
ncbi:MAG TPA: response regulator [Thermodesulfovibrionales bacterium]|nr:response regulator [Thermodesulfovibrionales bacterium]